MRFGLFSLGGKHRCFVESGGMILDGWIHSFVFFSTKKCQRRLGGVRVDEKDLRHARLQEKRFMRFIRTE